MGLIFIISLNIQHSMGSRGNPLGFRKNILYFSDPQNPNNMTNPIRRQPIALTLLLLLVVTHSYAQDTRTFNQNASRSNHTRGLSISFSPAYSTAVNTSRDSLLFRGSGGGLRVGADYFFGKAGIGITSGFGSSSADDANINNFLKNVSVPQDQLAITKSNQQNMYLLIGPSIQFGKKVQLYAHAKGGLFINNGGLVNIQQRGAQRAAYRNESTGRNVYPGFQTGLNFQYSFKSDVWSFGIGADYMGTKTEVMNYDARRGGGIEGLKLSRNISDIVAGVSIRYNIRSPRDAASGQATGRRVLPTVNKRELASPRDAASGLPTGKRVLPTVNKRESALPRDAASGRATGKRSYQPGQPTYGNITEVEEATTESCGPVTKKITHPDGTMEEMTFSCPNDALAYAKENGDYIEQPTQSSSNRARTVSNAPGTRGIISGRLTWPAVGNTGIITNAIITNNSTRGGSATLNSQTSSTRQTQQSSFGTLVRMSARDAASGQATGKRSSRDAASGLATGKRSSRDAASGLATGKRSSRDAASGLATGRRQYEPMFIEGQGEVCNPCLAKTNMASASTNPLYTDKGMSGNNPLYNGNRTTGTDDDCDGIAGMSVSLVEMNSGVIMAKTITEQCGDFFFANVPDGEYIVKVTGSFLTKKAYDVSVQSKTDLLGTVEEADQSVQLLLNTEQGNDAMQQKAGISTSRSNIRCKSIAIIEADLDGDGEYESLRATATFSDGSSQDITSAARTTVSNAAGSKGIVLEGGAMQMERRRAEVLKSNKQGDPNANRLSAVAIKNTNGRLTATGTFSDGSSRDITESMETNTAHAGLKQYTITIADSDDDGIADAVIKTKTKSNQSNDRIAASSLETEEIESPRSITKILSVATGDLDGDGLSEMMIGTPFVPGGPIISAKPGSPIGGLSIKGGKNPGGNIRTTQTDNNGEFEFTDLEEGNYTFTVEQRVFIDDETPVVLGNRTKGQDHNSSRSNKTSSFIANNPDNNSNKVQDHNSSRSNKSSSVIDNNSDNNSNKAQDHNSSRSNKTSSRIAEDPDNNDGANKKANVGPVRWTAPESTQRAINTSHSNIKNMLSSLDELDQQLDTDQSNAKSIVNTSRSNIKNQRAAVNDLQQTLDNLQTKDKDDALKELDQRVATMNAQFGALIESVQKMGSRYSSVSNVLKTRHDTVKNSIGNIR